MKSEAGVTITVLIDTYNYGRFIEEAIDSVLAQDYPMEQVEILVVDDGSTDDTATRVKKYGERIRYFRKENGGQASAFNFGFAQARGDIIALLDSDDYFLPQKLRRVVGEFEEHPEVGTVYHPLVELNGATGQSRKSRFAAVSGFLPEDINNLLSYGQYATTGYIFRRNALQQLLPMPEGIRIQADAFLSFLAPLLAPVLALDEELAVYRVHGGNLYYSQESELSEEQKEQRAERMTEIGKEIKSWIEQHRRELNYSAARTYWAWWFLTLERERFGSHAPGRWKYFLFCIRYQHAFRPQQNWKFAIYNYAMTVAALAFGYRRADAVHGWQEKALRGLHASRRKLFGPGKV